jgi:molecular chaperone GrpE
MTKKREKEEDILKQKAIEEEVKEELAEEKEELKEEVNSSVTPAKVDKTEEYLNGWKRTQADFENYKKDQAKRMEEFRKFACLDFVLQILPVVDNFQTAIEHVPENEKESGWVTGINYILKQLEDVLKNYNVTEIETKVGDHFDPEVHEAIESNKQQATSDKDNKIIKVVQKGYKIDPARNASHSDAGGGKVIRAARVIVE